MLRDAAAARLGRPPVHLFLLWSKARTEEAAILADIEARFEVLDRVEITWTQGPRFAGNLSRMYGSDLPPGSDKELHCGTGPLLVLVVADPHPRYRLRRTNRGVKVLNSNVFDARRRYRSWTGGGHKVHASDSVAETRRNLALLLGEPLAQLRGRRSPPGSRVRRLDADLAGADGWATREQLLLALRTHGARVGRPRSTGSVTVTAADVWEVELVAGGRPAGPGRRTVPVAGEPVELTLRESRPARARALLDGLRTRLPQDRSGSWARLRPTRLVRAVVRRTLVSTVSVRTDSSMVALTFDDGPDVRLSGTVLDLLREHDVRATFLLVADRVREHPELARRVVAEGHEVGLHGDRHAEMPGQPFRSQLASLRRGRRDVETILGVPVRWFRPPYGKQEPETVLACRLAGMRPLLWSTSAHDWERHQGLAEQLAHVDRGLRPGAVVLLHDGAADADDPAPPLPHTQPEVTEQLLELIKRHGLQPVTISTLVEAGSVERARWFEQWLHH